MTTPQNHLNTLAYEIKQLRRLFETEKYEDDLDEKSMFEKIDWMYENHMQLMKENVKIQDQMALIIKLLGKNEPSN